MHVSLWQSFVLSMVSPGFMGDVAGVCALFLFTALVLSNSYLRHLGNFGKKWHCLFIEGFRKGRC